jgi:hypothetical protein
LEEEEEDEDDDYGLASFAPLEEFVEEKEDDEGYAQAREDWGENAARKEGLERLAKKEERRRAKRRAAGLESDSEGEEEKEVEPEEKEKEPEWVQLKEQSEKDVEKQLHELRQLPEHVESVPMEQMSWYKKYQKNLADLRQREVEDREAQYLRDQKLLRESKERRGEDSN